jgi:RND superfamily putative drug exporter
MKALAHLATRRPIAVLLGWVGLVVGLQLLVAVTGQDIRDTFSLPGTDSQEAYDLLDERFPTRSGDVDTIAYEVSTGSVTDPAVQAAVDALLQEIAAVPSVASIVSPYSAEGAGQISANGTIAYATVTYNDQAYNLPLEDIEAVEEAVIHADATEAGAIDLTIGQSGQPASRLNNPEVAIGELIGVGIAAIILFVAFGSLMATTIPLIGAIVALTGTMAVLGLTSHIEPVSTSAPLLAVLLGLGIGIDYALFIVNRHRLGLKAGRDVSASVVASVTTSGRAVVFAGVTVFIALGGMLVPQIAFLTSLAVAAAITVLFSVAASITLVPALLKLYGHRVLSKRERAHLAEHGPITATTVEPGRFARLVERRPIVTSLVALGVLGALAVPALDLRLGTADQGNDPQGNLTRVAYDLISDGFGPGANGPLVIAVDLGEAGPLNPAAPPAALGALLSSLAADPEVVAVLGPLPNEAGDTVIIQAIPAGSPQDESTELLVERVRDTYAAVSGEAGLTVHVGGAVAGNMDFTDAIADSLPVFFLVVVGLSMLVLTVAFRSLVLPLVGAAMNMLSAAAAFGITVAVFQWGWGHQVIGIGEGGPIEPFAPLILFALLFGLSMDYQVFLVSRVAELWHATGDNNLAVKRGLAEVSRVIIAAASIMVVVFGSFVTSEARVMKLLGLGLAAAIFIDAFVIRVVLMPAIMRMLGKWNWWMPQWLDRILPHLDIDGHDVDSAPATEARKPEEREKVLAPV